jgi:hypothetical protein
MLEISGWEVDAGSVVTVAAVGDAMAVLFMLRGRSSFAPTRAAIQWGLDQAVLVSIGCR